MSRPRIAVVGSCASRDAFNRSFAPNYKEEVDLVFSVYQCALPSLHREEKIEREIPETITRNYIEYIRREYSGRNTDDLVKSRPDVIVMDSYADVQFGVTEVDNKHVTRNHMAFTALSTADAYYAEEAGELPAGGRFEGYSERRDSYCQLAKDSIAHLLSRVREKNAGVQVIVNSARFAPIYTTCSGLTKTYENPDRLAKKNKHWNELDQILKDMAGAQQIIYPEELIIGQERHKWGLNPVHYGQAYYDYFWQSLKRIIKE